MRFFTKNPATGKKIKEYQLENLSQVSGKLAAAKSCFAEWKKSSLKERKELLTIVGKRLENQGEQYAQTITREMGKVIKESRAEVAKCATLCHYYAQHIEDQLAGLEVSADGKEHRVEYEPLGVILTIMPWNFPFWQALRFAIPTIAAGNSVILKHSNIVPECALQIEQLFVDGPKNLFQTIITDHSVVEAVIASPEIKGVSFTGSTAVGQKIGKIAGENLKKMVLELGGSDPFIVLDDADIEQAAQGAVLGRLINGGQSCIAAKRFIVLEKVASEFIARFSQLMSQKKAGDPTCMESDLGPLVDEKGFYEVKEQVAQALAAGACLECGQSEANLPYFHPTVLSNVNRSMRVMREEVFGPVAPVIVATSTDEAIEIANDTEFGLGASVWSRDLERARKVAAKIEAGTVFINSIVKSDPRMPFGGVKCSGIGRELSHFGLHEFVNIKGYNLYPHIN